MVWTCPCGARLPADGQVIVRLNNRDLPYRYQDVRHTLLVVQSFLVDNSESRHPAVARVRQYAESLKAGTSELYGYTVNREGKLTITRASMDRPTFTAALSYTVQNHLKIDGCVAARIGRGVPRLGTATYGDNSIVVGWQVRNPSNVKLI